MFDQLFFVFWPICRRKRNASATFATGRGHYLGSPYQTNPPKCAADLAPCVGALGPVMAVGTKLVFEGVTSTHIIIPRSFLTVSLRSNPDQHRTELLKPANRSRTAT